MNTITIRDVSELAAPDSVAIPDSLDGAREVLDGVGGLMSAGHWGTAAIVWTYTEPGTPGPKSAGDLVKSHQISISDFAALRIRGLSTRNTVRKYRHAWQDAIDRGLVKPCAPGELVTLPDEPFSTEMMPREAQNSGVFEWYTPQDYIEAARATMGGIDLDPASCHSANEVVQAERFYTIADDGLNLPWRGRVWLNPPYCQPLVGRFADKLITSFKDGDVTQAIVLLNNCTETQCWQRLSAAASIYCFPAGRVRFWNPNRESGAPLQGQSALYFGDAADNFAEHFMQFGRISLRVGFS